MELDITRLINQNLTQYSASIAECGDNVTAETWENAVNSDNVFLRTNEQIKQVIKYLKTFGAWEQEELNSFNKREVNALVLQLIAGDLKEYLKAKRAGAEYFKTWDENCGGRIFETCGKYYYYLGE